MFTLITLVLLALLAGITLKTKRILSKKKETVREVRKAYTSEVLNTYRNRVSIDTEETGLSARRKKITKSKWHKRFI